MEAKTVQIGSFMFVELKFSGDEKYENSRRTVSKSEANLYFQDPTEKILIDLTDDGTVSKFLGPPDPGYVTIFIFDGPAAGSWILLDPGLWTV